MLAGYGLALIGTILYVIRTYRLRNQLRLQQIRNEISTDLHDDVGTALSSITFLSDMAQSRFDRKPADVRPILERIMNESREMMQTMRGVVWVIDPQNDKISDFFDKVRSKAGAGNADKYGFSCCLNRYFQPHFVMIRVAIFDDNKTFTDNLILLFDGSDDYVLTGTFSNALNVLQKVAKAQPDVIIMDIKMPEVSGIEAVSRIKQTYPAMQILMQTVFDDDDKVFAAICAGASGYILKGTPPDDLLEAIAEVYTGGSPMSPSIARKVLSFFQTVQQPEPAFYDLSKREKEILKCLVDGMSYKLIADACCISINTVNSHIRKIYEKLHVNSSQEAVAKALRQKLI